MTVFVTKADGSRQLFDREKIVRTCLRVGATREVAEKVADRVEKRTYDGMETRKVLRIVFAELKKHRPAIKHLMDLRKALSMMRSKPDFEVFVQFLLREYGYDVEENRIIRGKCVEHEVDGVATKDNVTYFVEVKHHINYHTLTGLDESRIAWAVLEDVKAGFELGTNNLKIERAMIVSNTKLSERAKTYAHCKGIHHIGWNSPPRGNLREMIEEKQLHPITCLKSLDRENRTRLAKEGIVFLKHLAKEEPRKLQSITGIPFKKLKEIKKNAQGLIEHQNT